MGDETVVDLFPGDTNTNLLRETLADILPFPSSTAYVLETIKGTADRFKADFRLSFSTKAEATVDFTLTPVLVVGITD